MIASPQSIQVARGDAVHDATISWHRNGMVWTVELVSPEFESVSASADDAFEALCRLREEIEPRGWRVGVIGAQPDVWPSGMAREQGGGVKAYRLTPTGAGEVIDTFEPVHPSTVATLERQREEVDRLFQEMSRGG